MKFMNMKRFGAAVMGGVMALSMATPAFASANVEITGSYEEMEIAVVVTDSGEAQINPYGLPVELTKSDRTAPKATISNEQITCPVMAIRNQSTTPLNVGVSSFVVMPKGELAIGTSKDTNKTAAVKLQVAELNESSLNVLTTAKIDDILIDKFASSATWTGLTSDHELAAPTVAAGVTTLPSGTNPAKTTTTPIAVVRGAAPSADAADAGKLKYDAKGIALFRLKGDLASDPVDSSSNDNPWEAADGFTAKIVFTFKPATPNGATMTAELDSGSAKATFTAGTPALTVEKYTWTSSDTTVATVVADTGTTNTSAITAGSAASGSKSTITCTATLSNGSKLVATFEYTKP